MQLICIGAVANAQLYISATEMADVKVSLAIKKATKNQHTHIHTHSMSGVMLCTIMFIYVCILADSSIKYNGHTS